LKGLRRSNTSKKYYNYNYFILIIEISQYGSIGNQKEYGGHSWGCFGLSL
jgi:hypothetical protein